MQVAPVQVTVVEYVAEFFRKYKTRAYGKTISSNAKRGADAFMGMLKLVLAKGGREELRIALHCFKDQLKAALHSAPSVRSQHVDEVFALLSSVIDAAEKLRQFSPVKESISSAVLEEVRWRLFRVLVGDGFSEYPDIRRRALDIVFAAYMREQSQHQQQQQRHKQLAAAGAAAGHQSRQGSPGKATRLLQRKVGGVLVGPDVSSWDGLWCSLAGMSGRRMMPLLQSVMADLYQARNVLATTSSSSAAATVSRPAQQSAKQQQLLPQSTSKPAAAPPAAAASRVGAAMETAPVPAADVAAAVIAPAAVVAADSDEALCGVSTPPLRTSNGDAETSRQYESADMGSSAGAAAEVVHVDVVTADAAELQVNPRQYLRQQAGSAAQLNTTLAQHDAADGAEAASPTASEAAAAAGLDNVVYVPGAAGSLEQSGQAWLTCASFNSSSYCPTDCSLDGTDASVVSLAMHGGAFHGAKYADGTQTSQVATAATADANNNTDVATTAASSGCASACTSPTSSGKKGLAAKFKEFKESVKESVANVKESVAISGSHSSHSLGMSGSSGGVFGIPRAWVQFHHRQGHDRDQDELQQGCSGVVNAAAAAVAAGEDQKAAGASDRRGGAGSTASPRFDGEDAADWSTCSGSAVVAAAPGGTSSAAASVRT